MTLSEHGGRLVVSVQAIVAQQPRTPSQPAARCGVDLGIGGEWAVIAHHDDAIERITHPAPWAETHTQRRRVARQRSRRMVGSRGYRPRRTPSWQPWSGGRPTSAPTNCTPLPPGWHDATAPSWSRTSTSPRWAVGWGGGRFGAPSPRRGWAGSVPPWPTSANGSAASFRSPAGGSPPPRPTMAAVATRPTSSSASGCGCARGAGISWTTTRMRPATSVTGPDRSLSLATSMVTGMSSGVELPPRCRWWATTAGRPTLRVARARPQKTTHGGGGR